MCGWYYKTSEDHRVLQRSKGVQKSEFNNILRWLGILVCNLKCYNLKSLEWDKGQTLVLEKTQENSIESFLQSSLPYIPIQMVCANYCASYPKWPCVKHEVNICYPCCMMSLFSRSFYFLLLSSMINVVTTPSNVPDVTVWLITSNPKSRVLKIEKIKNKSKIK